MKVLIDTNVIIDAILKRQGFFSDAHKITKLAELRKIKAYVSASAITDIYYIIKKEFRDNKKALQEICAILQIFKIAKVDQKSVENAARLGWDDFEDAVQYCSAKKSGVKCIVTRDKQGFAKSEISVFLPKEFLANAI